MTIAVITTVKNMIVMHNIGSIKAAIIAIMKPICSNILILVS